MADGSKSGPAGSPRDQQKQDRPSRDDKGFRQQMLEDPPALGEAGSVSQGGRKGSELARKVGSRDEEKRAFERPSPVSRVRKGDERQDG